MSRYPSRMGLLVLFFCVFYFAPAQSQEPAHIGQPSTPGGPATSAEAEPTASIFNDQLRRFKFELEHEMVTAETAESFVVRYQRPDRPRIVGAYPDTRTNTLFVIGPPEAEQAIRECLAQQIVDTLGLIGPMPLEMQLRLLQHERKELLLTMADLEIQEVAAAAQENGPQKVKQLAAKRQIFEDELKIAEQQIRIVRKYMARLTEDDAPAESRSP